MHKRSPLTCIAVFALLVCVAGSLSGPTIAKRSAKIPAPEEVLGFKPGEDRKLGSWTQVIDYFTRLDAASNRVRFETLGQSTMGNSFVMATISAPENLEHLEEYKAIQAKLADPRLLGSPVERDRRANALIARGKTIVLITCGIHSTEVGSYLTSMLIAYRLASSDEPEIQEILKNTIILLVPSLNPDGVDIVKNWYDKTLNTPYEGTDPPELYHKYTGHDNNRDWYAFTQIETQIAVDRIHNVWHPQIVHDIHQQGAFGSRLFLPPYMKPVEPNVPKQIVDGYTELGNYLAKEMRAKNFKGITTNSTYDAWSPSRAYSHYHAGVRILSETASAKIASPITVKFEDLVSREGYDPQKESPNFGPVWPGGEWHLRDITECMTTTAFLLLKHASENREEWLRRFYEIGREAVRARRNGEVLGFLVEPSDKDNDLSRILFHAGIETVTSSATAPFKLAGKTLPAGTRFIRLDQPYGSFVKAVFESQRYPNLRDASGQPIEPYDVTAHSLPLLMGFTVHRVLAPYKYSVSESGPPSVESTPVKVTSDSQIGKPAILHTIVPSQDEGWTRWLMENKGFVYGVLTESEIKKGSTTYRLGPGVTGKYYVILVPDQSPRNILEGYRAGAMPPEIKGGIGPEGVNALLDFVKQGGTLVFLNRSSEFAIEQFKLPVKNVVAELPSRDFYVPGSILRIQIDTTHPLAAGMPADSIAWVEDSPVLEVVPNPESDIPTSAVKVIASYPGDKDALLSGWLLGGNRIRGKAALVEISVGRGHIILFGFRPQYRAQSSATYPLFFNALTGK